MSNCMKIQKARLIMFIVLCFGIIFTYEVKVVDAASRDSGVESNFNKKDSSKDWLSLQSIIDRADAGSQITLEAGTYNGNVEISKPLTIVGVKDTIVMLHQEADQGITISSSNVSLQMLHIIDQRKQASSASITATGDSIKLIELKLETQATGIAFTSATNVTVQSNTLNWNGSNRAKQSERGNGIQLYHSVEGLIEKNSIDGMYDGIYTENSSSMVIRHNTVKGSRYAYHMMYGSKQVLAYNNSVSNITGMMIMTSQNVELLHNNLAEQVSNVNAQGILLYDTKHVAIKHNQISNSRVGLYIERSDNTELVSNDIRNNFVGMQMLKSKQQVISNNNFIGNVSHVWSDTSSEVKVEHNYWDSFQGLDTDGDSYSDLAYRGSPFFMSLIESKPGFQLFFGTNGVQFVEQLYQHNQEQWLTDIAPNMQSYAYTSEVNSSHSKVWIMLCIWLPLLALAVQIIKWGRREEI